MSFDPLDIVVNAIPPWQAVLGGEGAVWSAVQEVHLRVCDAQQTPFDAAFDATYDTLVEAEAAP